MAVERFGPLRGGFNASPVVTHQEEASEVAIPVSRAQDECPSERTEVQAVYIESQAPKEASKQVPYNESDYGVCSGVYPRPQIRLIGRPPTLREVGRLP